jgi:hypothetical protein
MKTLKINVMKVLMNLLFVAIFITSVQPKQQGSQKRTSYG